MSQEDEDYKAMRVQQSSHGIAVKKAMSVCIQKPLDNRTPHDKIV